MTYTADELDAADVIDGRTREQRLAELDAAGELTDGQLRDIPPARGEWSRRGPMTPEALAAWRASGGRPTEEQAAELRRLGWRHVDDMRHYKAVKRPISIRLDAEVVERFKAKGKGWQGEINRVLRQHLGL